MKVLRWIGCLLVVAGGCSSQVADSVYPVSEVTEVGPSVTFSPTPRDITRLEADEVVQESFELLNELNALELIEVTDVVVEFPEGQQCIYACIYEPEAVEIRAAQNARLEHLVEIASELRESSGHGEASEEAVLAALGEIESLDLLVMGELIVETAPTSALCYNLPCHEDQVATDEANAERARDLVALASQTREL